MRNTQQFEPGSFISLSKSIPHEELHRNIQNPGLPKARTPSSRKTILKKSMIRPEIREKSRRFSNSSNSLIMRPLKDSIKKHEDSRSLRKGSDSSNKEEERLKISLSDIDSQDSTEKTLPDFEKVKNFLVYNPHNNIESLIKSMKKSKIQEPKSPRKKRGELLMKFKKVVNTVKNSSKMILARDFSRKNDYLRKSIRNYYSEDVGSPEARSLKVSPIQMPYLSILDHRGKEEENILRLEKVPMEKEETKEEIYNKIGLANIVEEENEWNSYDRGEKENKGI